MADSQKGQVAVAKPASHAKNDFEKMLLFLNNLLPKILS